MEDTAFSSYLLGRLVSMGDRPRAELQPPAAAAPAPVPAPREPTDAERNQHFLDHVEEIAGRKPPAAKAAPEQPPKVLSRSSPTFQRQFSKWAEAIASGQCGVVD